jgi:hypothetical protein
LEKHRLGMMRLQDDKCLLIPSGALIFRGHLLQCVSPAPKSLLSLSNVMLLLFPRSPFTEIRHRWPPSECGKQISSTGGWASSLREISQILLPSVSSSK